MTNSHLPLETLLEEKAVRKARSSFKDFVSYTMPEYTWGWFNEYLAYKLQKFYEDYEAGKNPRLMIFAPPRSGKSEQASRRFPAWLLGKDNNLDVIATSYGSDLANRMSRDCQRIVEDPGYQRVFPESLLAGKNLKNSNAVRTTDLWEILNSKSELAGGAYRAAGVGGGITGQGFKIGIIDDPVKDYKDASSKQYQITSKEWYDTTFYTRRDPIKNGIILIMTRWHKQDLGGQLLEEMKNGGDQWDIVSFPMQATEREIISIDDKKFLAREKGEILFPERMPEDFVKKCKSNALTWSALYQQNPTIAGGNFFKAEHWEYWTPESIKNKKWVHKIITADTAQKKGKQNDYTVFQVWGYDGHRIYLLHQKRGKWFSFELTKVGVQLWAEYGGGVVGPEVNASSFYIEDKVSGTGLIQELRNKGIPCVEVPRQIDKVTRAMDCHSYFESGFVVLPSHAPWLSDYLMEFEDFNLDDTHAHDDQVDPTLDAINILLKHEGGLNYGGY
jgi:predicted phage terminase large subunit-like protein